MIECCVILHNLLIVSGDEGDSDWILDDFSDIDDEERVPVLDDDDELMLPVPTNAPDDARRQMLTGYISENFVAAV